MQGKIFHLDFNRGESHTENFEHDIDGMLGDQLAGGLASYNGNNHGDKEKNECTN